MNAMPPRLLRMRRLATALLVAMACLFIVARWLQSAHPVWGLVRAFAEAALIGGLADWFAVTALFRQPLGLPIPHTGIIPANQNRLADGVAEFLQQNFLTRRVLREQLRAFDFAAVIGTALRDEALRGWLVQRSVALAAGQLHPGGLLADWLQAQLQRQRHQQWFDQIGDWAQRLLQQHHGEIYQKVSEKSPRWMPRRVNDELYQRLMDGLAELLEEMLLPESAARLQFEQALRDEAAHLAAGGHAGALADLMRPPSASAASAGTAVAGPGLLAQHLDAALATLAARLEHEAALREQLNRWLQRQAVLLLVRRRTAIVGLVRRVIAGWDTLTVADRIEARVGRDLQFIRINGTLVGGAVGLLIHIISITI